MTDLATRIERSGALKRGKFKLSDGALTDYYVDKYAFETDPAVLAPVATALASHVDPESVDVVAGPALGAVPLVTAVSLETGVDAAYVRTHGKHRGAMARVEGPVDLGDRVVVFEDVTNTGGTVIETANLLEDLGAAVERLVTVVDRDEGASANVADAGYEFEVLLTVGEDLSLE